MMSLMMSLMLLLMLSLKLSLMLSLMVLFLCSAKLILIRGQIKKKTNIMSFMVGGLDGCGGGGVQSHFHVQPNCCVEVVMSLGL